MQKNDLLAVEQHTSLIRQHYTDTDPGKELKPKFDFSLILPTGQLDLVISGCNLLVRVDWRQVYSIPKKTIHCGTSNNIVTV